MIVYLARAIHAFVMYCVNGTSRSSLLIESTDSMITLKGFTINADQPTDIFTVALQLAVVYNYAFTYYTLHIVTATLACVLAKLSFQHQL